MNYSKYSVIIVGSGISGLYSALKLQSLSNFKDGILLVTKSELKNSNSYYAQGGMVAVLENNENDSAELHISDTLKAGAGLSEIDAVKFISEKSNEVVKDLLNFGVDFDRDELGNYNLTKEAAHSVNRILHCGGDATGREMEVALCEKVKINKNIDIMENSFVVELLVNSNNECKGLIVYNENDGNYEIIYSNAVIIATGGLGQLYKFTTNPIGAVGDGYALCYRAGAILQDMEFVQFHPTAFAIDDAKEHNRFLISEAVRGEGAKLCDEYGNRFMSEYDSREDLAPRDVVARSIFDKMKKLKSDNVFLDATVIESSKILKRFPTIYKKCLSFGIDITKDFIPVAPAAHYFMGGVKTNLNGMTSVKNLFAVGEVASTGLHGANRLASNSLLECVVCAYSVAKYLKDCVFDYKEENFDSVIQKYKNNNQKIIVNIEEIKSKLKQTMWDNVGIYRCEKGLKDAYDNIISLEQRFGNVDICFSKEEYELKNMLTVSKLIILSALQRKESRGAHYRTDYLQTDVYAKHSTLCKKKGELVFC